MGQVLHFLGSAAEAAVLLSCVRTFILFFSPLLLLLRLGVQAAGGDPLPLHLHLGGFGGPEREAAGLQRVRFGFRGEPAWRGFLFSFSKSKRGAEGWTFRN